MYCSVEGCDRKSRAKGMCHMHYYRVRRNGSTDVTIRKGTFEEMYGIEKAKELREKLSIGHTGLKNPHAGETLDSVFDNIQEVLNV